MKLDDITRSEALAPRFWAKVARPDDEPDTCWPWTGARSTDGYGSISVIVNGQSHCLVASRIAVLLTDGEIPDDMDVRHDCDNPPCVRRSHLIVCTSKQNSEDMVAKGRHRVPRGEDSLSAKLTEANVRDILARCAQREKQHDIGRRYGITGRRVGQIKDGHGWKHVERV